MGLSVEAYFEDHQESGDLGRRALRGGIISVALQYCNGFLQILAAIVLARLLTPADFGLVAIITVLTSFAPLLIDFGLGDATTQRSRITRSASSRKRQPPPRRDDRLMARGTPGMTRHEQRISRRASAWWLRSPGGACPGRRGTPGAAW